MAHISVSRVFWLSRAHRASVQHTSWIWAEIPVWFPPHTRQVIAFPILLFDPVVHPWPCLEPFRAGVPFHHDEITCLLQQTLER